jgi:hypothetical protein
MLGLDLGAPPTPTIAGSLAAIPLVQRIKARIKVKAPNYDGMV